MGVHNPIVGVAYFRNRIAANDAYFNVCFLNGLDLILYKEYCSPKKMIIDDNWIAFTRKYETLEKN